MATPSARALNGPIPLPPIFIADDETDDLFLLEHRRCKAGVPNPLIVSRDGEELVQSLARHMAQEDAVKPCLLLLDLNMPLGDGFDVMQWLRDRPEFNRLPVAVITSLTKDTDRARARECGVTEYLEKFPTATDLTRVVARASSQPSPS